MSNNIFKTLIDRKINDFIGTYGEDADSLFKNDDNELIHPGEYGMYREECLKQLLKNCIKKTFSLGDGFIYNKNSEISTQCDIIIYNSEVDGVTSNGVANFYPVEEVYAIGEVKSTMNKDQLRTALRKLAKTKQLFSYLRNESKDPARKIADQVLPITFLVCKKIQGFETINEDYWNSVYDGIDASFRHNLILSVDDGCLTYSLTVDKVRDGGSNTLGSWSHPVFDKKKLPEISIKVKPTNKYHHFYLFLGMLRDSIEDIEKRDFPIIEYLNIRNTKFETELLDN